MEPRENTLHLTINFSKKLRGDVEDLRRFVDERRHGREPHHNPITAPCCWGTAEDYRAESSAPRECGISGKFSPRFPLEKFLRENLHKTARGRDGAAVPWNDGPINVAEVTAARPKHTCYSESARQGSGGGAWRAPVHMYVVTGGRVPPTGRHRQRLEGAASVPPTLLVRRLQQRLRIAMNTNTADDRLFRIPAAWTACQAGCKGRCAPPRARGSLLLEPRNGYSQRPDSSANYTAT